MTPYVFGFTIDDPLLGPGKSPRVKEYGEDEVIVKWKSGVTDATKDAKHNKEGNLKLRRFKYFSADHVLASPDQDLAAALARYASDPNVEYVVPNYQRNLLLLPNEPAFGGLQWNMNNTGQTLGTPGADIRALPAWDITTGSPDVVVMVIDTGFNYNHPDLAGNVWLNPFEAGGVAGADDDLNGWTDDLKGIDAANVTSDPMDTHNPGHGTHVSGIVGAVGNNNLGVVGVNWNVKMIGCKILRSDGVITDAAVITCLEYARDMKTRGINIVATNNSYGQENSFSQPILDAIKAQQDILYIAAAGNSALDNDVVPFFPANFDSPNVLSVASTDHNDARAIGSHWGRRTVHISAPGQSVTSTVAIPTNSYLGLSGTSMAAPHVTGAAALLKAQDPTRDWRAIKNLILAGGDPIASANGLTITGRRLNVANSMNCLNRPVFSVVKLPASFSAGTAATVSALSIDCANAVGPVTATTSAGETFTLLDDGFGPDLAAGDGVFTANWTPALPFSWVDFTSPAGTERVNTLDIALTSVTSPPNLNRGEPTSVSAVVTNTSTSGSPEAVLNFYVSADANASTGDLLVGTTTVPALAAGASTTVTGTVTVPPLTPLGAAFFGAVLDPANLISEGNEANNTVPGNPVSISVVPADLTVNGVTGPATANTGATVTLNATVLNTGTAVAGPTTLNFYLSSNAVIDASDYLLGSVSVPGLLGGGSTPVSLTAPLPRTAPAGTYFYAARADATGAVTESNELNNDFIGTSVTTTTQNVDLTLTAISGPTTSVDQQSVSLSATMKNLGTVTAPASSVTFYASTDNLITTADTPIITLSTTTLAAGSSRTLSTSAAKLPASLAAGSYYIGAIVDAPDAIVETNELNNSRVRTTTTAVSYRPDLVMSGVSAPASIATGQSITFNATLRNQGLAAINTPIDIGFYASTDATISTADQLIGTTTVPSIGAGASVPVSLTTQLRVNLPAGTYTVGAFADYTRLKPESNENNNAAAGGTMVVTIGPDFTVSSVTGPTAGTRGQAISVNTTIFNQGSGGFGSLATQGNDGANPNPTSFQVGVYLSKNAVITANDTLIGTATVTSIAAGQSLPLTVPATIPVNLATGTYYIGVIADRTGVIREQVETNNARAGNTIVVQ